MSVFLALRELNFHEWDGCECIGRKMEVCSEGSEGVARAAHKALSLSLLVLDRACGPAMPYVR